ncbi:MAG: hypothetical protein AAF633_10650 [Chloroflexota bacterium]
MSHKQWVVREIAYRYDDNFYYVNAPGGIHDVYSDEADAYIAMWELECNRWRKTDLKDYQSFSFSSEEDAHSIRAILDEFCLKNLGYTLSKQWQETDYYHIPRGTYLPDWITDDQILELRELTGLTFFDVWEFADEPSFYGIWLLRSGEFLDEDMGKYGRSIYFFNSHDEAIQEAVKRINYVVDYQRFPLKGNLEELSDQPLILSSLIAQSDLLTYHAEKKILNSQWRVPQFGETMVALNALLKEPFFEIRTISLEDARKVPHLPFTLD